MRDEAQAGRAAVFLDKDGTLIDDLPFNVDPDRIRLAPGVAEGLPLLEASGYKLAVVSNQSGVARGLFPEAALEGVEQRIRMLLAQIGVNLHGFYYCPHYAAGSVPRYSRDCSCRKPAPGLLLRGAGELGVALESAWLIGDILDDVEAGRRAGCRTILIDNGNETEWKLDPMRLPHHTVADVGDAARLILALDSRNSNLCRSAGREVA